MQRDSQQSYVGLINILRLLPILKGLFYVGFNFRGGVAIVMQVFHNHFKQLHQASLEDIWMEFAQPLA